MSFWPDPDDDNSSRFEIYDLKMLMGYAVIAWAIALSIGASIHFS